MHKYLIMAHLLGTSAWIGGHLVLLGVVLPAARRSGAIELVVHFEKSYGRIGLAALAVQIATGLVLAGNWIGSWRGIFSEPTPAGHLILTKLVVLAAIGVMAGHASHVLLPRLTTATLHRFTIHAWIVTVLSVLLMVCGVAVRTGGLLP